MQDKKTLHQIISEVEDKFPAFLDIHKRKFNLVDMRMYAHKIIDKINEGLNKANQIK